MFSISNIEHLDMEEARQFLESSTIHGLYYISTSKKWARIFWIVVSFVGFTGTQSPTKYDMEKKILP